ncbi:MULTISPECIES: DUF664 domain-containing protein [Kocuria]|uniref:DUF664 domain-containing protein n=1 Tax=Kocuria subflava TaxID=1736139 RepID=A0A846TNZ9_9MICC|nr:MULTISPECIES: DUF664 domain-containing protein [Kocuria]NKE10143.1 DUF664 domain-containing protein [Kocuria subflava]
MPFFTRQVTTETDALAAYAAQQIHQLATTLIGLDDEQIRATPTASEMSLASLARHCLYVGNDGLLATAVDPSRAETHGTGDISAGEPLAAGIRPEDTSESLIEALEDMAQWAEDLVPTLDMDARVEKPDAPWYPQDLESWPMRWVVLHYVEEYARHAGHADIIRQSIDGKTAYELNALADGEPWPPEDWGKNWDEWVENQNRD